MKGEGEEKKSRTKQLENGTERMRRKKQGRTIKGEEQIGGKEEKEELGGTVRGGEGRKRDGGEGGRDGGEGGRGGRRITGLQVLEVN